ncbi:PadR family transcriptional regulator [Nonomuraea rubra]|uniref:DNA-binding PadR family transcriptional regulator n=1 Tax=Nonomuraea rubra TaxID=46180 RepID=A0A7X0NQ87_9ACTN|nr:PadR family transcriptional regulator [Nonomuraea rubra]MBB6547623.1 DNA-binding PadR family transcriptional regulator [Nonomuraea rubra]
MTSNWRRSSASLRYGLLGLLAEGPASGYDLARRFHEVLGALWPAQQPKIYAELNRLAAEGLIEVESEGPRRRKAYRITDEGLAAVRGWLTSGEVDHTLRIQAVLRSAFFWLMEPEELRAHLEAEQAHFAREAERYRQFAAAKDPRRLRRRAPDTVAAHLRRGRAPPLPGAPRLGRLESRQGRALQVSRRMYTGFGPAKEAGTPPRSA